MEKKYHVDGKLVDMRELIQKANDYGYDGDVKQTSIAARILRENGHKVGLASDL